MVAELELLLGFGSSVPGGGDTVAVLVNVVAPVTIPVIVITTLPPTGSTGTVPLTELPRRSPRRRRRPRPRCRSSPPRRSRPRGTLSMNVAPSAGLGPALVITSV